MMFNRKLHKLLVVVAFVVPCVAQASEKAVGYDYCLNGGESEVNYKREAQAFKIVLEKPGTGVAESKQVTSSNDPDRAGVVADLKDIVMANNSGLSANDKYFDDLSHDEKVTHFKNILKEKKGVQTELAKEQKKFNSSLAAAHKRETIELIGCALIIVGLVDHIWGKQVVKKLSQNLIGLFVPRNSAVQHSCSCKKNMQAAVGKSGK